MSDDTSPPPQPRLTSLVLLTDEEAAERMQWTSSKIKRLRLTGKLPYYPGRPPKIDAADLVLLKTQRKQEEEARATARYSAAGSPEDEMGRRARHAWLKMRFRQDLKTAKRRKEIKAASAAAKAAALADVD